MERAYHMSSIECESEVIHADKGVTNSDESLSEQANDDGCSELTAAAALTSLIEFLPRHACEDALGDEDKEDARNDDDADNEEGEEELEIPQRLTKSGRKRAVSFPLKLMKVLSTHKHADVISWTPSGNAFEIRNPKQFVAHILPEYFKDAKYSSFIRKLNRWNFQRHYRGDEAGAFYHQDFKKDRMDLVEQMTCKHEKAQPVLKPTPAKRSKHAASSATRKNPPTSTIIKADSELLSTVNSNQVSQGHGSRGSPPVLRVPPVVESPPVLDLNVAIEMEIARRLKERIDAAVLSQQAFALLEQQKQQLQFGANLNALLDGRVQAFVNQQQQQNLIGTTSHSNLTVPASPDLLNLLVSQVYQHPKPNPSSQSLNFNFAFGDHATATAAAAAAANLPTTNIQGARTA